MLKTGILAFLSVAIATGGQLLLRAGMSSVGFVGGDRIRRPLSLALDVFSEAKVIAGLILFGLSALIWLVVLSRAPLSFAYPFAGLTYALVSLFGKFVLGEHISMGRWFGISLIIGGIILVGVSGSSLSNETLNQ